MRTTKWTMSIAALLLCGAAQLQAQGKPATNRDESTTATRAAGNRDHTKGLDNTIASCLVISNQEEIALAKLAVSHAENPKVKQFAELLIKDHQKCLTELRPFSGETIALQSPLSDSASSQERESAEATRNQDDTRLTAAREVEGLNFLNLKRQVAEKSLQSAEKQWNTHRGPDGDKCFVGTQVVMHQQMIDAQEVLKQDASPKLQAEIDKSIEGTRTHLKRAEELMKELASNSSETQKTSN